MKRKIVAVLGVVVLFSSLLVAAMPVSAGKADVAESPHPG